MGGKNMREQQYSIYEKYNLMKNSMVLSTPLIASTLLIAIVGGIVSLAVIVNSFEKSLPLSYQYVKLYMRAMFTLSESISFEGKEVLATTIEPSEQVHLQNFV